MLTRFRSKTATEEGENEDRIETRNSSLGRRNARIVARGTLSGQHIPQPGRHRATGDQKMSLDIDVRRFQGVFFDKGAARFYGIAHQGGEQLIGSNRILHGYAQHTTAIRIHRGFPQLIRVHLAQPFIALDRQTTTGLFHQPVQRLLEAGYRLTAFATFDKRVVFDKPTQFLAQRANTTILTAGDKLVIQRIVGVHAVRTRITGSNRCSSAFS